MRKSVGNKSAFLVESNEPNSVQDSKLSVMPTHAYPYCINIFSLVLFWILTAASAGVFYLVFSWFPIQLFKFLYKPCTLSNATHVLLNLSNGKKGTAKLQEIKISMDTFSAPAVQTSSSTAFDAQDNGSKCEDEVTIETDVSHSSSDRLLSETSDTRTENDVEAYFFKAQWVEQYNASKLYWPETDGAPLDRALVFDFGCLRYIFELESVQFQLLNFNLRLNSPKCLAAVRRGIPTEKLIDERRNVFGPCRVLIPDVSMLRLLVYEVLHPFYIFQLLAFALWIWDEYYQYAFSILGITVFSSVLELYEIKSQRRLLRSLADTETTVKAYRLGLSTPFTVSSTMLVPGDVIQIENDMVLPADVVLLDGSVIVDEATLTGESVPILKNSLPEMDASTGPNGGYSMEKVNSSILYAGTKIVLAESSAKHIVVMAVIIRTAYSTVRGRLLHRILNPTPLRYDHIRESYKYISVLFLFAFLCSLTSVALNWNFPFTAEEQFIRSIDIYTDAVPPAMPAALCVGVTIAVSRLLYRKRISCVSPSRINISGSTSVFVFDKTGTLTEDGLDLECCVAVESSVVGGSDTALDCADTAFFRGSLNPDQDPPALSPAFASPVYYDSAHYKIPVFFEYAMACCHSLSFLNDTLIGENLERVMFGFSKWKMQRFGEASHSSTEWPCIALLTPPSDATYSQQDADTSLQLLKRFEFYSSLQRMSVIVRNASTDQTMMFCKGSPEIIRSLCLKDTLPKDLKSTYDHYASNGFRILALAYRTIEATNWRRLNGFERREIEKDLTFLGLVVFSNHVKPQSAGVIRELRDANCTCIMATGDNPVTAVAVGRKCNLIEPFQCSGLVSINVRDEQLEWCVLDAFEAMEPSAGTLIQQKLDHLCKICQSITQHFAVVRTKPHEYAQERVVVEPLPVLIRDFLQITKLLTVSFVITGPALNLLKSLANNLLEVSKGTSTGLGDSEATHCITTTSLHPPPVAIEMESKEIEASFKGMQLSSVDDSASKYLETKMILNALADRVHGNSFTQNAPNASCHCFRMPKKSIEGNGSTVDSVPAEDATVDTETTEIHPLKLQIVELFIEAILQKTVIFARMSPMDKGMLIKSIQNFKTLPLVAMCGDGGNDCDALNVADMSVSLSEAEPSVAASFRSHYKNVECCVEILKEGRSALINSIQLFKFIFLYAIIQTSSVVILYYFGNNFSDSQYLWVDVITTFPLSIFMSWTNPASFLSHKRPPEKLFELAVFLSIVSQCTLQIGFQIIGIVILTNSPFYTPFVPTAETGTGIGQELQSYENAAMFLISDLQIISVCIAFSQNYPWRKSIFTNVFQMAWLSGLILACVGMTLIPKTGSFISGIINFIRNWLFLETFPLSFALMLTVFIFVNSLVTIGVDRFITKNYGTLESKS